MKLKVILRRDGFPDAHLLATLEVGAKVADLAAVLAADDPRLRKPGKGSRAGAGNPSTANQTSQSAAPGLRVIAPYAADLDPEAAVGDSGLRSGMTVSLVARARQAVDSGWTGSAAVLLVTAGPDQGLEFRLPRGTAVIGRDVSCAVRLADPLVSRRHAQITVGEHLEVTDLASANGLEIGGAAVPRALLRAGDTFQVGDTELRVEDVDPAAVAGDGTEGFNRPPRLSPVYDGEEFASPRPPQPAKAARIPIIPLFTPLLLGAVLYFTTHSAASLVFVGLSPLMAVGYAVEAGRSSRRDFRKESERFRAALADLTARARAAAVDEAEVRGREHPSLDDCAEAIRRGTALLWTRRPGDPAFGELRLATGTLPSRTVILPPDAREGAPALLAELADAVAPFARVDAVPVAAAPGRSGAIGLAGPRGPVLGVARGLAVQAAALHSPAELLVTAFASTRTARDWD